eukprot:366130-Chlamydomonas_euryale.AAC.20
MCSIAQQEYTTVPKPEGMCRGVLRICEFTTLQYNTFPAALAASAHMVEYLLATCALIVHGLICLIWTSGRLCRPEACRIRFLHTSWLKSCLLCSGGKKGTYKDSNLPLVEFKVFHATNQTKFELMQIPRLCNGPALSAWVQLNTKVPLYASERSPAYSSHSSIPPQM